ncbi:MAG: GNAT family N-acetyltransferase [Phycisphaerae bacterium]
MSTQSGVTVEHRAAGKNGQGVPRPAALTVRPAGRSDLVPLNFFFDTVLRRDYFVRRGQLEEILSGRYHQVYVAEIEAVLVGVAITTCGSRLVNALVHPAYRGLGIGRALVNCSGATEVRAKLDMSTGDPRRFYRALGFVSTGIRNGKGNVEVLRRPHVVKRKASQKPARPVRHVSGRQASRNGKVPTKHRSRK